MCMLDEMFHQNASNFAMLLYFFPNECINALVFVDMEHGINLCKNKVARNEKKLCCFFIPKVLQILKHIAATFHQA